jgi:hypothetical protein
VVSKNLAYQTQTNFMEKTMKLNRLTTAFTFCGMLFFSLSASAVAITPPVPVAPTGLTATTTSVAKIDLNWQASSGATYYRVFRANRHRHSKTNRYA